MLYLRVVALIVAMLDATHAFAAGSSASRIVAAERRSALRMVDDPTGSPLIKAINSLQEAIQSSPAANFKKGLAKLQAGDYDEVAVKAELDGYLAEPAVMFSFTT